MYRVAAALSELRAISHAQFDIRHFCSERGQRDLPHTAIENWFHRQRDGLRPPDVRDTPIQSLVRLFRVTLVISAAEGLHKSGHDLGSGKLVERQVREPHTIAKWTFSRTFFNYCGGSAVFELTTPAFDTSPNGSDTLRPGQLSTQSRQAGCLSSNGKCALNASMSVIMSRTSSAADHVLVQALAEEP